MAHVEPFAGVTIDPQNQVCLDEVPILFVPVKTCMCEPPCDALPLTPSNVLDLGKKMDPRTIPLIVPQRDITHKIAYWGQNEDTVRNADVILVPAKYAEDPIVGIEGNGGFGPSGEELQGLNEELARLTGAKFGHSAHKMAPFAGCRNIWCDLVYIDEFLCLGVYPVKRLYEFFDDECMCFTSGSTQEVADFVTDRCLDRILPDDGFNGLPMGYPEAISFEYCALPEVDKTAQAANAHFLFSRSTPSCARPDQGYFVRVEITSLSGAITVDWADVLPAGHVLISGAISDTLVFTASGQTITREYVVRTPAAGPPASITGVAQVSGQPPTALPLMSDPVVLDEACPNLILTNFGSQNPNVFGQVFWAGGGRVDPTIPPDAGLWVKIYAGQGSAGLSKREQLVVIDTTVPAAALTHTFRIADITGFAVGLPVWVFNKCFQNNPLRSIMCLDIEEEEAKADPDEEITGLYGEVTAIDPSMNEVTVKFFRPPNQAVDFTLLAKATMMVAPDQSKGFYWEASPALANLCGHLAGIGEDPILSHCIIRWSYRFWNSTHDPCPGTLGAAFVCDGDGQSKVFEFHGDVVKNIINPVDWIDLWCSPIREIVVKVNVDPGDTQIEVCDICTFTPLCDVIQLVDTNCTGKEGNGPGYVGRVLSSTPIPPGVCGPLSGLIEVDPPIPSEIPGCGIIDGFKTARKARVFVKPDICRVMASPTTKCGPDGAPLAGPDFACVDFEEGIITFDPSIEPTNPMVCFRGVQAEIQLDITREGVYFLRAIDKSGCVSPPSKAIRVIGPDVAPPGPSEPALLVMEPPVQDTVGFLYLTGSIPLVPINPLTLQMTFLQNAPGPAYFWVSSTTDAAFFPFPLVNIRMGVIIDSDLVFGPAIPLPISSDRGSAFPNVAPGGGVAAIPFLPAGLHKVDVAFSIADPALVVGQVRATPFEPITLAVLHR